MTSSNDSHGRRQTNSSLRSEKSRRGGHKSIPRSGAVGIAFDSNPFRQSSKKDHRIQESQDIFDGKFYDHQRRRQLGLRLKRRNERITQPSDESKATRKELGLG